MTRKLSEEERSAFLALPFDERLAKTAVRIRDANPWLAQFELEALLSSEMQFQDYDREEAGSTAA